MPEICRFYGIIIRMFWADHPPPHFHAIYGEYEAIIEISSSEIIEGSLPLGAQFGEPMDRTPPRRTVGTMATRKEIGAARKD